MPLRKLNLPISPLTKAFLMAVILTIFEKSGNLNVSIIDLFIKFPASNGVLRLEGNFLLPC